MAYYEKVPKKVGHLLNGCEDFLERIKLCVWASDTFEEFEAKWADKLVDFNLGSNDWLCNAPKIKHVSLFIFSLINPFIKI